METKHTKGDWEAYYSEFFKTFSIHNDLTSTLICHLNSSSEEAEANAKLIAAAPELLEALIALINANPRGVDKKITNQAIEAIKKATE